MKKDRIVIKRSQIWQHKKNPDRQLIIVSKKGSFHFKAKVLTGRTDVYAGTHTMTRWALEKDFNLMV